MNFDFEGLYTRLRPDLYWGGEQAAWWSSMAIAVIAGLTFATFLTLVLLPVMHSLLDGFSHFLLRHTRQQAADDPAGGTAEGQDGSRRRNVWKSGEPESEPELVTTR